ncbi:hypothetical protein D6764_02140 [Candidatus Woesearchaeota archaeon]|nr:MAG: hypothetical protein D6764_02140 [Candidatus Woesearchaeota archaeon]
MRAGEMKNNNVVAVLDMGATFWKGALYRFSRSSLKKHEPSSKECPVVKSPRGYFVPLRSALEKRGNLGLTYSGRSRRKFTDALSSFLSSLAGPQLAEVSSVIVTGGNSASLPPNIKLMGVTFPVFHVPEFDALANSAFSGTGVRSDKVLAVSVGTGTAMVLASRLPSGRVTSKHVSGTGIGGGTLSGLASALLNVSSFSEIERLSMQGVASRCNLTIGDILGSGIGLLPADATASNLASLSSDSKKKHSPSDVARACFSLVAETVGMLSLQSAKANGASRIIFSGTLAGSPVFREDLSAVMRMLHAGFVFHPFPAFAALAGALRHHAFSHAFSE